MNKRSKLFSILVYALVFACILILCFSVFSSPKAEEVSYSEMCALFRAEQVEAFTFEDNVITMKLSKPMEDGATTVQHELASLSIFYEDLGETIRQQSEAGTLKEYNYLPMKGTPWYVQILPYALMMILLIVAMYFLMARAGRGDAGAFKFGKANVRVGTGEKKVTFADVAGAEEEKQELEEIVDFLRNPQKYRRIGAKIPKGVLLVGPPGTGKTLIAKAVAGEAGVQFLSISGSDFVELYVGVGASRVRDLFEQAKKGAPSIIFIDEIDAVGRRRGAGLGGGHDEREQTLNQLLVEMDGFEANDGIIVMALPQTGRTSSTRRCCAPAVSTGRSMSARPTSRGARRSSRCTRATSSLPTTWTSRSLRAPPAALPARIWQTCSMRPPSIPRGTTAPSSPCRRWNPPFSR